MKTAPLPLVQVGKVAVAALVSLFAATTYSTWPAFLPPLLPAPIREVAKMPAPSAAKRLTWAPSASAGLAARTAESSAMCR